MDIAKKECEISDDDLRAALKEMGTYVDVTEDDLKKIYSIALRSLSTEPRRAPSPSPET